MCELDLHGYTTDEALRIFVDVYNRRMQSGSCTALRLIHGYGSSGEGGKIRRSIRAFLQGAAESLGWVSGEELEGNPGITVVHPKKLLPSIGNQLAAAILVFCSIPRTESKIAGEFRKYGQREIKQAIRSLVRQAQMKEILKGGRETYVNAASEPKKS